MYMYKCHFSHLKTRTYMLLPDCYTQQEKTAYGTHIPNLTIQPLSRVTKLKLHTFNITKKQKTITFNNHFAD